MSGNVVPEVKIHEPYETRPINGGTQRRYRFANGYGASVVNHSFSYGGAAGLWELAVTDHAGKLDYSTPITDDVLGHLSETKVQEILTQIAALPHADL